ncbi:hypothetical protein AQJ64_41850 [Streptomyces griseoruber]|uniref:Uncharacterized protein n=1 Tax=Streptomyces griseoruber TaxID=1943 RepID=A0A101SKI6_9ACTN|nr:hypothetical protein AQJ64_41850 [Streptomyces griseoruber]
MLVAGRVLGPAERQMGPERGQVGSVDVGRGHLIDVGGEFGAGPLGAGCGQVPAPIQARTTVAYCSRAPGTRGSVTVVGPS